MGVQLGPVILNCRDWPGKLWLPEEMCLKKQPSNNNHFKKSDIYWYNINNAKKNWLEVKLHNFKVLLSNEIFVSQPYNPILSQSKVYFRAHKSFLFQQILALHHCDYFHLQCLAFLFIKVQTFVFNSSHGVCYM